LKNRKLFAIITLVAFMMTLLPLAAFAAADRHASIAVIDKTSVTAGDGSEAKITVYVRNSNNSVASDSVYVVSSRATTDTINQTAYDAASGKYEFKVKSDVVGTAQIAVGLGTPADIASYLAGGSSAKSADEAKIIKVFDLTFTASGVDKVRTTAVTTNVAGATVSVADPTVETTNINVTGQTPKGNGIEYYEITFTVTSAGGAPVADQEVVFSVSDSALKLNKTTATTDAAGTVKVRVTAEKAFSNHNEYVRAKAGDKNAYAHVNFDSPGVFDIVHISGGNEVTARNQEYSFKFRLNDLNGNRVTSGSYTVTAPTRPSDVSLPENMTVNTDYTVALDKDNNFEIKIPGGKLNKDGDYVVRVSLDNGKYIDVPFTVKKQGELVRMELSYDTNAVALGASSSDATIKYYDAEGIVKKVSPTFSGITFSATPGAFVTNVDQTTGAITFGTDRNLTGTILVTAVDTAEKLSATYTMTVAKEIAGFEVTVPENAVVNETTKVQLQLVDVDGLAIGAGNAATISSKSFVVTSKPADAVVTANAGAGFDADLKEKGNPVVDVKSNVPGEVTVTVVVGIDPDGTGSKPAVNYAKTFTVNFGLAPQDKPVYGAKNVTMFIGSTGYVKDGVAATMDQAPFIQDNRTFVPVRMVATALGATNEDTMWDPATQTITLVRPDMTVTMTVGSNVLTKSDGTTVVADVAPFIVAETGRTVIPFRAIAEAFGADVEAVFAADGTVTAVTFQQ